MSKRDAHRLKEYNKYRDIFIKYKCKLLTTVDEFIGYFINVIVTYKATCDHENTMQIKTFINNPEKYLICNNCFIYNKYVKLFKDRNCVLLYSLDEFIILLNDNSKTRKIVVNYEALCSHENTISLDGFDQGYGNNCDKCVNIKQKSCTGDNRASRMEDRGIVYLKKLFENIFEIKTCDDGTIADFAMRNIGSEEDLWLMVQLKTTDKSIKYGYKFNLHKNKYNNCIILCLCENEEKLWILNGNDVEPTENLYINKSNTCKYPFEEIAKDNLINSILKYYNILDCMSFDEINIPLSLTVKKEQEFRKYRDKKCNFLTFMYPEESNMIYDFTIGNLKVQEKVARICYNRLIVSMYRSGAKCSYKTGDNSLYWIHFPCKNYFLLFPENILIKDGYISTETQKRTPDISVDIHAIHDMHHKYNEYLFDYNNIDEEKLLKITENILKEMEETYE